MDYGLLTVFLVALLLGYYLGRRRQKIKQQSKRSDRHMVMDETSQKYINGLNYLLSEKGDAAAEAFIDALPVAEATLQTHIALGRMLRKSGEISSAIRTHQSLLASPYLDQLGVDGVQFELALDYVAAGLFDRAEAILVELVAGSDAGVRQQALHHLVCLYRDEGEWQRAIDIIDRHAERRFVRSTDAWSLQQSHFCCELVQQSLKNGQYPVAQRQLKLALTYDKRSVRAGLLAVGLEVNRGEFKRAVKRLKKLVEYNDAYWPQYMPLFESCFEGLGQNSNLRNYLFELSSQSSSMELKTWVFEQLLIQSGEESARSYLEGMLESADGLLAVQRLLQQAMDRDRFDALKPFVLQHLQKLQQGDSIYQCQSCGYSGNTLDWLCPSCKCWGAIETRRRNRPKVSSLA